MPVKRFTDLRAWQLANRLRNAVYRFTEGPPAASDRRFCDDIRAASVSVCANLSEGFARYTHREFAHFVVISRGSLAETQDHLLNAKARGYVRPAQFDEMWTMSEEAMRAVTGLLRHLREHPTPMPHSGG